jgi:hypothetical protein
MSGLAQIRNLMGEQQFGTAILLMFQLLEQRHDIILFEDDLVYCMNEFSHVLQSSGNSGKASWIWKKCLELSNHKSYALLFNYSR